MRCDKLKRDNRYRMNRYDLKRKIVTYDNKYVYILFYNSPQLINVFLLLSERIRNNFFI